jgi:hypothetical protein
MMNANSIQQSNESAAMAVVFDIRHISTEQFV